MATFGANWLPGDRRHERLVAHELAHQWFGNSLTLGAWRDIWLHEGFACYAEWLWSEASGGWSTDRHARDHHRRLARLEQDLVVGDPGPDAMFDDRVYKRGALTLHALRLVLGDAAFFGLLRSWVAAHADGTVTTADFVAAACAAGGSAGVGAGQVQALLAAWLQRTPPARPALTTSPGGISTQRRAARRRVHPASSAMTLRHVHGHERVGRLSATAPDSRRTAPPDPTTAPSSAGSRSTTATGAPSAPSRATSPGLGAGNVVGSTVSRSRRP